MNFLQKKILQWSGFSQLVDAANPRFRYQRPYESITTGGISEEVQMDDLNLLVSDSRKLFCNLGPAKGAICDKGMYSVGRAWDAKFEGKDKAWGKLAEDWVNKIWYPVADARGGRFDFKTDLYLQSISIDRDGEIYIFLTESASGWPQIQLIPSHMIGQRGSEDRITDGPYTGLMIKQGVILNDQGCAVAYRVLGQTSDGDRDYSARDLIQVFDPEWADQLRGFPAFIHALLDLKDLRTIQGNEKMASAICSSIGLMEHNELGAPDPNDPANFLRRGNTSGNGVTSSGPSAIIQNFGGITARFFRAGTGSKLETLKNERPGDAWDKFMNRLIRNACVGAGWPYELTWDSSTLGGANVRLLIAKAMRAVEDRQDLLKPVARRVVGYAVAKAIKLGILTENDEWYAWGFAMPARMSVDYGRDAAADREDYKLGIITLPDILEEEGKSLEKHYDEIAQTQSREQALGVTNGETQRNRMDLIGVGVRAGIITPSPDVEAAIRQLTGLPPMSPEVVASWKESNGVRTPITLAQAAGVAAAGVKDASAGGDGAVDDDANA